MYRFPECGFISESALQLNNGSQEIMPLGSETTTLHTESGNRASTSNNSEKQNDRPETHTLSHGSVQSNLLTCDECQEILQSRTALNVHAEEQQHLICKCECGKSFSRFDGLERHLKAVAQDIPKYPCTQLGCRRIGRNGFKRKDNLDQHLRTYHNMNLNLYEIPRRVDLTCPHPECSDFRGPEFTALSRRERRAARPFINKSNYTQHMKEVHDESPFPCPVPQCSKVGGKGYQREKDLIKHHKDRHPEAPPLAVSVRKVGKFYACPVSGCPRSGTGGYNEKYSLQSHLRREHGFTWEKSLEV